MGQTVEDLAAMKRDDLDAIATEAGLDPSEYSNKTLLAAAVVNASEDEEDDPDVPPAESERRLDVDGRMEHSGGWIVKSGIKYMSKVGETRVVTEHDIGEDGQVVKDADGKPVPHVITDIPFETAEDLYRRGVLAPHMH